MNAVMIGPYSQKNIDAPQESRLAVVATSIRGKPASLCARSGITKEEMKKINTSVYRVPAQVSRKRRTSSISAAGCMGRTCGDDSRRSKMDRRSLPHLFEGTQLYAKGRQISRRDS